MSSASLVQCWYDNPLLSYAAGWAEEDEVDAPARRIRNPSYIGDVLSSGVFWTAVGSVAAVVAAVATVIGLKGRQNRMPVGPVESWGPTPRLPSAVTFGEGWGEITPPVRAQVGVIDSSDIFELGLSAMQLDNIGFTGEYNAVVVSCVDKKARARIYNAFGMQGLGGGKIRISSALAEELGCAVGEDVLIEGLAVIKD